MQNGAFLFLGHYGSFWLIVSRYGSFWFIMGHYGSYSVVQLFRNTN